MDEHTSRPFGRKAVCRALVDAAIPLVARYGVAGVTTRQVADHAQVNQGLITRYFGSKKALIRQVATEVATRLFDEADARQLPFEALVAGQGPRQGESFRALIHILLDAGADPAGVVDHALVTRFIRRLERESPRESGGLEPRMVLTVALILGLELVGPSLQTDLGLDEAGYQAVRRQAAQLFAQLFATS